MWASFRWRDGAAAAQRGLPHPFAGWAIPPFVWVRSVIFMGCCARLCIFVLGAGSVALRCLDAARRLRTEWGIDVELLPRARLQPLDLAPVMPVLAAAGAVVVVEESSPGGGWAADVAARLHD